MLLNLPWAPRRYKRVVQVKLIALKIEQRWQVQQPQVHSFLGARLAGHACALPQ